MYASRKYKCSFLLIFFYCTTLIVINTINNFYLSLMKYALILHLYYTDLWYEFLEYFDQLENYDLYVTLPTQNSKFKAVIKETLPSTTIFECENKGRDVLPFLNLLQTIDLSKYSAVCKMHTKKSFHRHDGDKWRRELIYNLIGTPNIVDEHVKTLTTKKIGLVGHTDYLNMKDITTNRLIFDKLCNYYQLIDRRLLFFEGTMFWISVKLLKYIQMQIIPEFLFDEEQGQLDGAAEHAYERIFGPLSMKNKLSIHHTKHIKDESTKVLPIAFYLPQYHSVEEYNDLKGENYTEWTALSNAELLFNSHQLKHPHRDIGYYNILERNIRKKQADIAKRYDVYGFCYHHYWFKGKQLLETPAEMLLHDNEPNLPFCFNWYNEDVINDTNISSINDIKVLIRQEYGTKRDWIKHIKYLIHFFKHKNYIKIYGKPVFLIYQLGHIEDYDLMLDVWTEELNKAGFPGIHAIQVLSSSEESRTEDYNYLIDGKCEFHPNILTAHEPIATHNGIVNTIDVNRNFNKLTSIQATHDNYYYGAFPCSDNTPKKRRDGLVYTNTTFPTFFKYIQKQVSKIKSRPVKIGPNFLFINAWNEWGEGRMLEPSTEHEYQYLNVLKTALHSNALPNTIKKNNKLTKLISNTTALNNKKIALCINDLDLERKKIHKSNFKYDIFLSTVNENINGIAKHFNFIRHHSYQEFITHLDFKYEFVKTKNFIKVAEEFYNAKVTYLLLKNYQRTHSINFDSLLFSNNIETCTDNLIIDQISISANTIYYKQGKYWFGKNEAMEQFFIIYDKLKYDGAKTFEQTVKDHFKSSKIKIVEFC